MAGHSKWAQIKRKKGVKDQERGKIFAKLGRVITIAVGEGGGVADPNHNFKLRLAVERAKAANMPKDNIARAIEKGTGPDRQLLTSVLYEAFGPEGVAILIEATTDNPNRTLSEVRNTLEKSGGKLGARGSTSYLFTRCGSITFNASSDENTVFEFAACVQAIDILQDKDSITVYFPFEELGRAKDCLNKANLTPLGEPDIDYKPQTTVTLSSRSGAANLLSLMEKLETLDDVQKVYGNFDIPEEFLK